MNKKKLRIIAVVILVIVLIIVLKTFVFPSSFNYAGVIEADNIDLSARVISVVESYSVSEGDSVKAGDVLVTLSCEDIKINSSQAIRDYERADKLFKESSMPRETYEHIKSKYEEVKTKLDWCTIKAPVSGTILTTYLQKAELANIGTKIVTMADLGNLWTYIYVAQPDVSELKTGMSVNAYLPEVNKTYDAKIIKINSEAEFTPKNVQTRSERTRLVYGVKVKLIQGLDVLKPGMTVEITLP